MCICPWTTHWRPCGPSIACDNDPTNAGRVSQALPRQYSGWQLLVPKPEEVVQAVAKKAPAKKATKSTSTSKK